MSDENVLPPSLEPEILPKPTAAPSSDRGWASITSLVLGIINLIIWCLPVCGGPLAILGLIFGIMGLKAQNRGLAIGGIVLNAIGLILSIIATIIFIVAVSAGWFNNFNPNSFNFQ